MKSILVVASYSHSLVNFRGALLVAMRSRGHQVHACAPGLSVDITARNWLEQRGIICHDITLSRAGLNPLMDLGTLVALVRLMRKIRPDLFLSYTIKPVIWGVLAARLARVSKRVALITGLGYAFIGKASGLRAIIKNVARILYYLAMRSTHLVIFQNPDDRNDFQRLGILSETTANQLVNGSGVDTSHFSVTEFPQGALHFLLIARLLGDKGIREFAAAAGRLKETCPKVEFHLVGGLDPNPNGISKSEIDTWTRDSSIIWHGQLDDVRAVIAESHVYVLPSYREGTPRSVLEAMSMGRPVITTDAPGCRETVVDGVNGFLVPARDANALADAMRKFIESPRLIAEMGRQSRRIAKEKYDVRKVNAVMIAAMGL